MFLLASNHLFQQINKKEENDNWLIIVNMRTIFASMKKKFQYLLS
jgi:hypothetical protein